MKGRLLWLCLSSLLPALSSDAAWASQMQIPAWRVELDNMDMSSEENRAKLMSLLEGILAGQYKSVRAQDYMRKAFKSGLAEFVPILREIGRKQTNEDLDCGYAQHALWMMGEPREYFVEIAKQGDSNVMPAYSAIKILARDPDDEILKLFGEIHDASNSNWIRGACQEGEWWGNQIRKHYRRLLRPREKIRWLMERANARVDDPGHCEVEPYYDPGIVPGAPEVWCRRELARIGRERPELVAEELVKLSREKEPGRPDDRYLDYAQNREPIERRTEWFARTYLGEPVYEKLLELEKKTPWVRGDAAHEGAGARK